MIHSIQTCAKCGCEEQRPAHQARCGLCREAVGPIHTTPEGAASAAAAAGWRLLRRDAPSSPRPTLETVCPSCTNAPQADPSLASRTPAAEPK